MIFRAVLMCILLCSQSALAALSVGDLTVDRLHEPLGLDSSPPQLSWKLHSDAPSTRQTAYEIRVAEQLTPESIVWQSGRVESDQSLHIPYSGPALRSAKRYQWQVRIWDNYGNVSDWSRTGQWEMGLLQPSDWQAQWITYPWSEDKKLSNPSPLFRKQFVLTGNVVNARLYITALGLYEASINSRRVGDAYFTPGWTSYRNRLQYQVYDVTPLLLAGNNAIGVTLGDGWYRGNLSWDVQRNLYGDQLALLAQLRVDYADGSHQWILSDSSWKSSTAEILSSDIYNGELQDLRLRKPNWASADYVADSWPAARLFAGKVPKLIASSAPPVREMEIVKPIALLHGPSGETIVDLGQNMVGWVRLHARGKAGQKITLYHTEVLDRQGAIYRKALRGAQQKIEYILSDEKPLVLQPHFSFQGFRYVQIDNFPGELTLDAVEGVALHSDLPVLGHFETSNSMLNRLQSNIVWGQRGNFLDVPTDCPQRDERLGWTGDIQVFANTAAFNMDSYAFLRKWLTDVALDQYPNGGIPYVAPDVLGLLKVHSLQSIFFAMKNSASGWGDVITIAPRVLYEQYGDKSVLAEFYEPMKRWVEYERAGPESQWFTWLNYRNWFDSQRRADNKYIWNYQYTFGDWLAPAPVSSAFVNTVYFAHSAQLLSEAAKLLGKAEDEKKYRELAQQVRAAFQRRFTTTTGLLTEDVQGAYVLALQFDMLDPALRTKVAKQLNDLVQKNANHLATGFLSTPYLLPVLSRFGYLDTAYAVLQQQGYPSWLYPITKGATTIWERWGGIQPDGSFGDDGMNSFNHYAYGAVGYWMYQNIGGITQLTPGYKRFRIAPLPGGDLTSASASLESPYGKIASSWQRQGSRLSVEVEVPVNTSAELIFPTTASAWLRDDRQLAVGTGIEKMDTDADGKVMLILGSGHYMFRSE